MINPAGMIALLCMLFLVSAAFLQVCPCPRYKIFMKFVYSFVRLLAVLFVTCQVKELKLLVFLIIITRSQCLRLSYDFFILLLETSWACTFNRMSIVCCSTLSLSFTVQFTFDHYYDKLKQQKIKLFNQWSKYCFPLAKT